MDETVCKNTVRDGWAHSKVNRWPREFFQSVGVWTGIRELLVKSKTATLRPSVQPFGQPTKLHGILFKYGKLLFKFQLFYVKRENVPRGHK